MNAVTTDKKGMLDALTSFRFIAAFMVFVWHSHVFHSSLIRYELGYVGVGFFYMLSGFILTYVYFEKLKKKNINNIKKFYIARVAKLYPVHIVTFLASIPFFLETVKSVFPEHTKLTVLGVAISNLSLTQSYFPSGDVNFSFNGVAWSISVELFFYALFPVIIFMLVRYHRYLTVKRLLIIMSALWIVLMMFYLPQQSYLDDWKFYVFPIARLPDFVMGVFLGMIFLRLGNAKIAQRLVEKANFTWLEIASISLLILSIILSPIFPQSVRFSLTLMPFWAAIIFVFAHQKGAISRIFTIRPLIFLGEISFSFYMTHLLVIAYLSQLGYSVELTALLSLVSAVLISSILYLFFEEPMRVWLKHFLESRLVYRRVSRSTQQEASDPMPKELGAIEQA